MAKTFTIDDGRSVQYITRDGADRPICKGCNRPRIVPVTLAVTSPYCMGCEQRNYDTKRAAR